MAGEWFAVDCCLETKPETVEILVATGEPVDVVIGRLVRLWAWAQLNSEDGSIKATTAILARVAGGDEKFWETVAETGWIELGEKTVTIAGWEKRFSQAAKRRMLDARRKADGRKADKTPHDIHSTSAVRPQSVRTDADTFRTAGGLEEKRREEKREDFQPAAPVVATSDPPKRRNRSQPKDAIAWSFDFGWVGITPADRQAWATAYPACTLDIELVRATEWLKANPTKARKSNWRRFLVSWLTRSQDRGGTNRSAGKTPEDVAKKARLEQKAQEFSRYQPASYRTPKEAMRIAEASRIQDEGSK